MTFVKTISIYDRRHAANFAAYIKDDRAIARSSQYIANEDRFEEEMVKTRAVYEHDRPSRAGAKCPIYVTQALGFNPDESGRNGKVTPAVAMSYVGDYVSTRYPNQEAVWVLHHEHCSADGTDRLAAHLCINISDISTGRRLDEGPSRVAKIERAKTVRALDEKYGLAQLQAGVRNSRIHARQPTKAERRMRRDGLRSDKQYIRDAVRASMREAREGGGDRMRDFAERLKAKGVRMTVSANRKGLVFEREKTGRRVGGAKLGRGFSMSGIAAGLAAEARRETSRQAQHDMEMERRRGRARKRARQASSQGRAPARKPRRRNPRREAAR